MNDKNNFFLPTLCAVEKYIREKQGIKLEIIDQNDLRKSLNLNQEIQEWAYEAKRVLSIDERNDIIKN
jgi:hypothetical protein